MSEDLANSKAELADVLELLLDSPDDEELLALKSDLEELIALAEDEAEDEALDSSASAPPAGGGGPAPISGPISSPLQTGLQTGLQTEKTYDRNAAAFLTQGSSAVSAPSAPTADDLLNDLDDEPSAPVAEVKKPKSKIKVDTEFEIPANLRLLPTDTEETKLKKRKKVKALKSKFKNIKSEVVATSKAASWQNFKSGGSKKKKRKGLKEESMFKTGEGSGVGVSSLDILKSRDAGGGEANPKRFKY
ncbi:hypothetical protein TrVE_jg9445 [Triparma verrucosa]|uniref:Uncharacterized protein n=1 Tax=Triparma verrucosa TaxID=1606542 RepID=A0A9W7C434_9STRA|nr:hypothetical protein TrVE_jg9445 [Triparma verrucosa]